MSPLTHLQVGAFLANARKYNLRERKLIMLASFVPDLDGLFIVELAPDVGGIIIGMGDLWERMHHTFSHNVFFCIALSIVFALYNRKRRVEIFFMCLVSSLLQILLDVLTNDESWPQQFLRPLTDYNFKLANFIEWDYLGTFQVGWLQYSLMALIFAGTIYLYLRTGRTFIEVVSTRLDVFVTDFIKLPFTERCVVCGARAFYRDSAKDEPLCPNHSGFRILVERKDEDAKEEGPVDD